jgi:hypothetical protein
VFRHHAIRKQGHDHPHEQKNHQDVNHVRTAVVNHDGGMRDARAILIEGHVSL